MLEIIGYGVALLIVLVGLLPVFMAEASSTISGVARGFSTGFAILAFLVGCMIAVMVMSQASQAREAAQSAQDSLRSIQEKYGIH